MKNLFFSTLFALSSLQAAEYPFNKPEEITYDWLKTANDDTGGCSHVVCFKEILNHLKIKTLLEFGLGSSTKYYLDSCKRVLSVEVITHGYGPDRLKRYVQFYKDYSNWVPIAYFSGYHGDMTWAPYKYIGSDGVYNASSYQCLNHKNYKNIDDQYFKELNEFVTNLSKYNKIEVAIVHPILYLRGDLVDVLFNKIPIIIAHGTGARFAGKEDAQGYLQVKTPENYEEIYLPLKIEGEHIPGNTVWIMKKPEYQPIIDGLKTLALNL